jgi:hypothetical protein
LLLVMLTSNLDSAAMFASLNLCQPTKHTFMHFKNTSIGASLWGSRLARPAAALFGKEQRH